MWQLPDTTGLKNEVVMLGGRSAFDSAIRLAGAKLVVVDTLEDLPNALNDKTAMVYTTWLGRPTGEGARRSQRRPSVPLMLDDAAGIPPIENLTTLRAAWASICSASPAARGCAGRSVLECCSAGRT